MSIDTSASAKAQARYHFDPEGHILETQPSSWLLDSMSLTLGAFRAPVAFGELAIKMPPVHLEIPPGILLEVSGYFSLSEKQADFACDLLEYHVNDLELISPHILFDIGYDQGMIVSTKETALWELNKMPVTLYPSLFKYGDGIFTVEKCGINYGSLFDGSLTGYYNRTEQRGVFALQKIDIKDDVLETGLAIGSYTEVEVSGVGKKYTAYLPTLDLKISTDEAKNWSAAFGDLSKIYNRSKFLQKFNIEEGRLVLSSVNGKKPYFFSADIKAPYPLFIEGNNPVEMLSIKGRLAEQGVFAKVNEHLDIEYSDKGLAISSDNLGYNVPALINLLNQHSSADPDEMSKDTDKDKRLHMSLVAKDSFLFFSPKCRVIADEMVLEYADNDYQMKISHGSGLLELHSEGKTFLVHGEGLNDIFMSNLTQDANFSGGETSISAKGEYDRFSAIFEIKNTELHNLKTVNNVVALINTLPALINFSLPEYSSTGLKINSALVGMKFDKELATIESLDVKTAEIQAAGAGWIDFSTDLIDLDIFLTSKAGRNLSKIPVVGYVVVGEEDTPSVTLKVKGNLRNPDVSTSFLNEVLALPSDMLYRTLNVPHNLFRKDRNKTGKK
ncbi:MAG: hypothetical protein HGB26_02080 [Desulfobulbaceae bacterium]|nr:hypothetical protein [Desulfobulbaceae bacterium]